MSDRAPLSREIALAAAAVEALKAGRALPAALDAALAAAERSGRLPEASRAAVRDMAHEAARRLGLVDALAAALNRRPPAPRLAALQAVALSQLVEPIRAEAVIVDQAVEAARAAPDTAPAAGFLNATLRRFLREREGLLAAAREDPVARWNHPRWWIEQLRRDHPADWQAVLAAADRPPPMVLRVNLRHGSVPAYLDRLERAGLAAARVGEQALRLERAVPVDALPGWSDGDVSVQDAGAQLAAPLLAPRDGERVLDACAGPGGKTTHLLELADCELTALDVDESRLAPVRENLARLGQRARVVEGDARRPEGWWDGRPFDRILVDAPCTASGIVRRHPDIRWLRRRRDLATLSARQSEILAALWPLLRPGGKLLYATCSVFAVENESVVASFLASHADAGRLPLAARIGDADEAIAQLLPVSTSLRDHDGFFYALLEKRS
ncbi:16S rRNA (cytosine(967)-C(5))-methyltransferase RsmB [Burkholderiaceae bacterium FT117]|uniref:16S rRNA (cytosine(967)-C(5))-methyltransferase RsmB n=1 Tax=Zeimonas sediminis TaxID=2944268 RepID=UPI0023431ABB|nr:16S rRNA (cytosine(967)-C(5))-methyltransferase RsmB [Zeimonas sediminis]MCM5571319.1 16S rRNA (cytosine(967)-C(5))-methyltransferase RsmB [Zeimonas sediminis]